MSKKPILIKKLNNIFWIVSKGRAKKLLVDYNILEMTNMVQYIKLDAYTNVSLLK